MDQNISRSEKKRLAKGVEEISNELALLSDSDLNKLPCPDFIKDEIRAIKGLKTGSRKRQIKYITKCLREIDCTPLLDFLTERKGSKLKQTQAFHELERIRNEITGEAIEAMRQADYSEQAIDTSAWKSETIARAQKRFPNLETNAVKLAALKYARTRKPEFSREIFKILKGALENQRFNPS